jgi:uncharacterized protein (DUF952 family)
VSLGDKKTIYKIFRTAEWSAAEGLGAFARSPDDIRDGFIHFSSAEQLRGTLEKYFGNEDEIIIVSFDAQGFGDDLKWEVSRGGMKFPHLYVDLSLEVALQVTRLTRDSSGELTLPDEIP